jgi:hypothetical protein
MEQNNNMNNQQKTQETTPQPKPNEQGMVSVQGHIKIFDPETKEVLLQKRA